MSEVHFDRTWSLTSNLSTVQPSRGDALESFGGNLSVLFGCTILHNSKKKKKKKFNLIIVETRIRLVQSRKDQLLCIRKWWNIFRCDATQTRRNACDGMDVRRSSRCQGVNRIFATANATHRQIKAWNQSAPTAGELQPTSCGNDRAIESGDWYSSTIFINAFRHVHARTVDICRVFPGLRWLKFWMERISRYRRYLCFLPSWGW